MLFLIHATYHYTFIAGIFASIKPLLDGSLSVNKVCKNHKGLKLHQEEPSFRLAFIFLIGYYLIFHAKSGVCNSKNGRVMAISMFSPNLRIFFTESLKLFFFAGIRAGSLDLLICKIWSL